MSKICKILDWDSHHYKKRIAKVNSLNLEEHEFIILDKWSYENNIDCIYYLKEYHNHEDSSVELDNNFKFVDTRIVYFLDLKENISINPRHSIIKTKLFQNKADSSLYRISDESIKNTRFYNDKNFDIELVKKMYRIWIDKSIRDSKSCVVIAELNNRIIGFITFNIIKKDIAQIGLVAIERNKQNMGVASNLMLDCIKRCRLQKIKSITVATQIKNHPAKMYYEKFGFSESFKGHWFHKWY